MNIWLTAITIAIVSIILALVALKSLGNKSHINQVKKNLQKGRVVFRRP